MKRSSPRSGYSVDFWKTGGVQSAIAEILELAPEPVLAIVGNILEDPPRAAQLLSDILTELMQVVTRVIQDADKVLADPPRTATAVENLVAGILTDDELLTTVGNFVGDLLEDEELMALLEEALYESITEATLGPDRYIFEPVHVIIIGITLIPVSPEQFKIAAYNALSSFTEVLMEWLRGENLPPGIISLPDFAREYPLIYMNDERVRENIAAPLTSFGLALALDLLRHPDLPGLLNSRINNVLSKDPLELIGKS